VNPLADCVWQLEKDSAFQACRVIVLPKVIELNEVFPSLETCFRRSD